MKSRIDERRQAQIQTAIVTCPDCGEKLVLKGAIHIGLGVRCHNCEAELAVVNMTPVELDGVPREFGDDPEFLARW
jgi:lysine biosynthesis protein LysW